MTKLRLKDLVTRLVCGFDNRHEVFSVRQSVAIVSFLYLKLNEYVVLKMIKSYKGI